MIKENKTVLFKKHIQMVIQDTIGAKVSQEKAWQLFKAMNTATVQFVNEIEPEKGAKTLSLSGVGKYQIRETEPTGKKAGYVKVVVDEEGNQVKDAEGKPVEAKDPTLPVWSVVPRFKFTPSSAVANDLYALYNCPGYEDVTVNPVGIFKSVEPEEAVNTPDEAVNELKVEEVEVQRIDEETIW